MRENSSEFTTESYDISRSQHCLYTPREGSSDLKIMGLLFTTLHLLVALLYCITRHYSRYPNGRGFRASASTTHTGRLKVSYLVHLVDEDFYFGVRANGILSLLIMFQLIIRKILEA